MLRRKGFTKGRKESESRLCPAGFCFFELVREGVSAPLLEHSVAAALRIRG